MQENVIGLLNEGGYEMANRVYDDNGLAPSIRTYQGGGLQPKVVEVKQATKSGYTECILGGGGGLDIPNIKDSQRTSNRPRECVSDSDNGEYP